MDWLGSWQVAILFAWLLAAMCVVALVAINPADEEDELLKAWLRDGCDPERKDAALNPSTIS